MEDTKKQRTKNLFIIGLIILALLLTGAGAYYLRLQNTDTRSNASTTRPIKVYFEPVTTSIISSNVVETNVYFESDAADQVTGGTVILKYPSDVLTFNKSRTTNTATQANTTCKNDGFKLEGVLDASDNGDGTATLTRFAPFTDPSYVPPSGKFCFGTLSFTINNPAATNVVVQFDSANSQWKVVGPGIVYAHTFGNASSTGTTVSVTTGTSVTPTVGVTTTVAPVATATPTPTATPTSVTVTTTPTKTPTAGTTVTPVGSGSTATVTPTGAGALPDTDATTDALMVMGIGTLLIISGVYVFNNRFRS